MSSNVEVVLISGGWTALVAVAGFAATIYNNRKTMKAAREDRMYDNRAETYVDVLEAVSALEDIQKFMKKTASGYQVDVDLQHLSEAHKSVSHEYISNMEARLKAFGTREAFAAYLQANASFKQAEDTFRSWDGNKSQIGAAKVIAVIEAAEKVEHLLAEQVRRELLSDGAPLPVWRPPRTVEGPPNSSAP